MKVNLIRDKECELSHRELKDRFQLSVGAISILKRKHEYISDYKQGGPTKKILAKKRVEPRYTKPRFLKVTGVRPFIRLSNTTRNRDF